MECLNMTYGRDFEPMAEFFFWFLHDFGISGYVHVLAHCSGRVRICIDWVNGCGVETKFSAQL